LNAGGNPIREGEDVYHERQESTFNKSTNTWTVTEARSNLGQRISRAQSHGSQTITRKGKKVEVVAPAPPERKVKRKGNLAEFLMAPPFRDSGIEIKPLRGRLRNVDI